MDNLKLNETPIRTSRNFNINNIKLENIKIPDTINKFNNIAITGNSSLISNNTSNIKLTYGIEEELINQIKEHSNIELKINCFEHEQMQVDFNFDENNPTLLENIEIIANESSKSTIILKYKSQDDLEYWHNGLIRVNAKKNSEINIILVNLLNMKSNNFMSIENNIEENAKIKYTIIDFGGRNSITNYYSNIIGED